MLKLQVCASVYIGENLLFLESSLEVQGYLPFTWENQKCGWKIKWFMPLHLENFRKYGLCFAMM